MKMFKCHFCWHSVAAGTKPNRVITQLREKNYFNKYGDQSFGWEIVEEVFSCDTCINSGKAVAATIPPKKATIRKPRHDDEKEESRFYKQRRRRRN
jgi:spore coat protein CotH